MISTDSAQSAVKPVFFITHDDHQYTHSLFIEHFRESLPLGTAVLGYSEALREHSFAESVVIFCDIERFEERDLEIIYAAERHVANHGAKLLLNRPGMAKQRFELQETLHTAGVNSYRVFRAPVNIPLRFPVFIRGEFDHRGPRSTLLRSHREIDNALAELELSQKRRKSWLIVEFVDTRDSMTGLFHKFGAFYLLGHVLPRHLFFSQNWIVKNGSAVGGDTQRREEEYIQANSHQKFIETSFSLARMQYGRIDFAATPDGLQVFEINSNPTVLDASDLANQRRMDLNRRFAIRLAGAISQLSAGTI